MQSTERPNKAHEPDPKDGGGEMSGAAREGWQTHEGETLQGVALTARDAAWGRYFELKLVLRAGYAQAVSAPIESEGTTFQRYLLFLIVIFGASVKKRR